MQVKLVMAADGSMVCAVDNEQGVTYEEAARRLQVLRNVLGELPILFTGEVERHVHGPESVHVHVSTAQEV